ncbi:unnamed protein product [Vicia faba]|uniref:Transmembrane protein n=1 Tax=Vicia faba TaxID=3906 RepID=A0AAV1AZV9_VICFA|nr:unnamed protein product [Vicia faba]
MVVTSISFESTFLSTHLPFHVLTITKLLTGISLSSPLPTIKFYFLLLRPLPEPPPPRNDKFVMSFMHILNETTMDPSLSLVDAHTTLFSKISCPPSKPPWLYSMKILTQMFNFNFLIFVLCFCVLVVKDALLVFDKMPQKSYVSCSMVMCVYWHFIEIEEVY